MLCIQLVAFHASAQFTKLLDFGSTENGTLPYSAPFSDGTSLYGMTSNGGVNKLGTLYKVKPDGTGFTKLLDFDGDNNGMNPIGALVSDGTFLYGMTRGGGANGQGTLFKILPDGTGYTKLLDFLYGTTGGFPYGSLIYDGTFLYGMTSRGGANFLGTLFKILPDGTGYVKLLDFDGTNGSSPYGSLFYDGTFLYGMTFSGGTNDLGTIVKIKPDGTGFVKLLDFTGSATGRNPYGSLISDGTFLYGMTLLGGSGNFGALFKIMPDGSGFVKLLDFDNTTNLGAYPKGSLAYDGTYLYGTTTDFGANGRGTIFKILTDGNGFVKLLDNDVGSSGSNPQGTLILDGAVLYGVKSGGGSGLAPFYPGTVFKLNTDGSGYTMLHNFETSGNTPYGSLNRDLSFYYGLTSQGGLFDYGTLFKIKPDGTGFERLLDFDGLTTGSHPVGRPTYDGISLYGLTSQGGINDAGTIFKIQPDGTGFVKLMDFDDVPSGSRPQASLITDGTFLYGMTSHGGANAYGTIFKIMSNGSGFTKLVDLDYTTTGAYPDGSLSYFGGFLFGMTNQGGTVGNGILFKVTTSGTGFTKLVDFDLTNGGNPYGSLIFDGTFIYGMTSDGGANSLGTVFKVKTDGTGFTTLLDFDGSNNGSSPHGSLTLIGSTLYGMTSAGGLLNQGVIFKVNTDGTNYVKLLDFNDGNSPLASLISDGTSLYGMTSSGGENGSGILFKQSIAPFTSITNFIPTSGVAGTYVTINGTNFDPTPANNVVKFNNTTAVVVSSSTNTLTAIVPDGATTGPISVTAAGTATSTNDFEVTDVAVMIDGTVQNCDVEFVAPGASDDVTETFLPVNPSDKVMVSFSTFSVGDILEVYDGPTTASPLIISLSGNTLPADITASGPGGELTFLFSWQDDISDWDATLSCVSSSSINIDAQPADVSVCDGQTATFTVTASGTTNITYQWQYSSDGINPFTDLSNGGGYANVTTPTLSVNTTTNFGEGRYQCRINGDFATEVFTNDEGLFINSVPSPPTSTNVGPVCGPVSVDLTASGGSDGEYVWYTAATGGNAISGQTNSIFTTPVLSTSTTYFVSIDNGSCESTRTAATADILVCNPPVIAATVSTGFIEGVVTIDLTGLLSDPDNNLDLSTLNIMVQPTSGATATLSGLNLTIDYTGLPFAGTDEITLGVCDLTGLCTTQQLSIEFAGDIIVFNAVSPNDDGKNEFLFLQYIDVLPGTQQNQVRIYNRWGDEVFSINDYNNRDRVFTGYNNNGNKLPSGIYFYKISFAGGSKMGYLELKYLQH